MATECFALRVRRLDRKLTRIYDEALRPHAITTAQFNLLVAISVSAPVAPGVVGSAMELERSSLSRCVAKLVERGWILTDTKPGPGVLLSVTAKGRRLLGRVKPDWERAQRQARRLMNTRLAAALASLPPRPA